MSFWVWSIVDGQSESFAVVINGHLESKFIGSFIERCCDTLDVTSGVTATWLNDVIAVNLWSLSNRLWLRCWSNFFNYLFNHWFRSRFRSRFFNNWLRSRFNNRCFNYFRSCGHCGQLSDSDHFVVELNILNIRLKDIGSFRASYLKTSVLKNFDSELVHCASQDCCVLTVTTDDQVIASTTV